MKSLALPSGCKGRASLAAAGDVQSSAYVDLVQPVDVKLAEALDDRAPFRRSHGVSANEATPERSAFVRFRRLLVAYKLDRALAETGTMQLKSKAVLVKTGTLVDATIIVPASEGDDDARWVNHRGNRVVHSFKVQFGGHADAALLEESSVTSDNINDGKAGPGPLPDNPSDMFAETAWRGNHSREAVCAKDGIPRIAAIGRGGARRSRKGLP